MSIILAMAFVYPIGSAGPAGKLYKPEFHGTSFMNGYAALESLAAASPIASAWAFPAAPSTAAAHAAAGALGFPAGAGTKTVLRSMVAATAATMRATLRCWAIALGLRAKKNALSDSGAATKPKETLSP